MLAYCFGIKPDKQVAAEKAAAAKLAKEEMTAADAFGVAPAPGGDGEFLAMPGAGFSPAINANAE